MPRASICRAADLMELGMYREALAMIDSLPDDLRTASAARRVWLRCAAGTGQWRSALDEAKLLSGGNAADRAEAARTFQTLAAETCKRGREEEARRLVLMAIQCRQEQIEEILADARFPQKFLDRLESRRR